MAFQDEVAMLAKFLIAAQMTHDHEDFHSCSAALVALERRAESIRRNLAAQVESQRP